LNNQVIEKPVEKNLDIVTILKLRRKHGLTFQEIADKFNTSPQAIQQKIQRFEKLLLPAEELTAYRQYEIDLIDSAKCTFITKSVEESKLQKAGSHNLVWNWKELNSQKQVLTGQASEIIGITPVLTELSQGVNDTSTLLEQLRAKQLALESDTSDE